MTALNEARGHTALFFVLMLVLAFPISSLAGEVITNESLRETLNKNLGSQGQSQVSTASSGYKYGQDGTDPFLGAVLAGDTEEVKKMIEKGFDVNKRDEVEASMLMSAALKGHDAVMMLLLSNGAQVDVVDRYGETALMNAVKSGKSSTVRLILDVGADVNFQNPRNRETALIFAARNGNYDICQMLVEKGADVNVKAGYRVGILSAFDYAKDNPAITAVLEKGRFGMRGGIGSQNTYQQPPQNAVTTDTLQEIKTAIAARYPGSYATQEMLVEAEVKSWKKLQGNYTDAPDNVFFEIRDNLAKRYPDSYSTQEMLLNAEIESWKKLNR